MPTDPPPDFDPLADSWRRGPGAFDPFQRNREVGAPENVTVLRELRPLTITFTKGEAREEESE